MSAEDHGGSSSKVILIVLGVLGLAMLGGALMIIVCITAITALGTAASNTFTNVGAQVGGPNRPPSTVFEAVAVKAPVAPADAAKDIRKLIEDQQQAWNRGDLDGFMAGYWRSPQLRMVAGNDQMLGFDKVLERYRTRYPPEKMGQLSFSDLDIEQLGPDGALASGRWKVVADGKASNGRFTVILRKLPEGWRIVHDHTSKE
jgi:beta-aspartyl-peptidase (threonine type)